MNNTSTEEPQLTSGSGWTLPSSTEPAVVLPMDNNTYTFSPPHTIWGMDVEMFSYIFLAIGGIAPIIFIVVVILAMRCYTWSKLRKFQKYEERHRPGIELWDSEGKHYQAKDSKSRHAYDGPGQVVSDEETGPETNTSRYTDKDYQGLRASVNNPNVYFREAAVSPAHSTANEINPNETVKPPNHVNSLQPADAPSEAKVSQETDLPNGVQRRRINSEEQKALDCFDKIYDSLDVSSSASESGSVPHDQSKDSEQNTSVSDSGHSDSGQGHRSDSRSSTSETQPPVKVGTKGNSVVAGPLLERRSSSTGSNSPSVKLKIHKPTETSSLEQRQSWLHTSFVNVAYEPEEENMA